MKDKNWFSIIAMGILMIIVSSSIIILLFNNPEDNTQKLSNKIKDEIKYLDNTILSMINELNNLKTSYDIYVERSAIKNNSKQDSENKDEKKSNKLSEHSNNGNGRTIDEQHIEKEPILWKSKEKIDWKDIELKSENLYDSWATATIDLNIMNVPSDNILAFNSNMDTLILSIREKNKINTQISLANLFNLLPGYLNMIENNEENFKINSIKSSVVSAYSLVSINKWEDINKLLEKSEKDLAGLINNINQESSMKQLKINKSYILLKELIKTSNQKNVELFYFKYINLIQTLQNI